MSSGYVTQASLGELLSAVAGRQGYHVGTPPITALRYLPPSSSSDKLSDQGGPHFVQSGRRLRPGDTYVAPLGDWLDVMRLLGLDEGVVSEWETFLLKLIEATPLGAVAMVDPAAWTVPPFERRIVANPPHTRITFSGVFGVAAAPVEIWSWNLRTAAVDTDQDAGALDAAAAACQAAWITHLQQATADQIVLTEVDYARINEKGHYATFPDGSYQRGKAMGAHAGNAPTVYMPLQTALCISLQTPRPGPTGKGRAFLPYQTGGLTTDFRLGSGVIADYSQRMAALIADVNGILGRVSVVSSKGYTSPVTQVRVGRVLDTMRSRRDALEEGYALAAITA